MRLVKSCEWLPQPVQDYKPIPLPLPNDESPLITTDQNLNGPSAAKVCGLDVYLLCCFSMAQATCWGQYIVVEPFSLFEKVDLTHLNELID